MIQQIRSACLCLLLVCSILTVLAHIVQVVQIAAHIVPQPVAAAVQHHAILLAVVVVGLVLAPGGLQHNVAYADTRIIIPIVVSH